MVKGTLDRAPIEQSKIPYREMGALNQSLLKTYSRNPKQFYKEFVLKEKRKEKDTFSTLLGSLGDFILLECNGDVDEFDGRMDEKFVLFDGVKGSGQGFLLADYIWEYTERDMDEENNVSTSFVERFTEAFNRIQAEGKYSKKTLEWAITDFENSPASEYFASKLQSIGKKVVDVRMIEKAKNISLQLMQDENTYDIFHPNNNVEVVNHMVVEWTYTTAFGDEIKCKMEADRVHFYHKEKRVEIFDLKFNYDNEAFDGSYLKWGYYIQQAFYTLGMKWWLENNNMEDYIISSFKFIVADTSVDNLRPLVYIVTEEDWEKSLNGFTVHGWKYPGLYELFESVNWALTSGIFNISMEAFNNKGQMEMKINYE